VPSLRIPGAVLTFFHGAVLTSLKHTGVLHIQPALSFKTPA